MLTSVTCSFFGTFWYFVLVTKLLQFTGAPLVSHLLGVRPPSEGQLGIARIGLGSVCAVGDN